MKKEKFLKTLGLDKNMVAKDPTKSMEKLQKLLIKEAKSRGLGDAEVD